MVKYTTEDIIKRASQLADMENSDFISDYEKLALLNENWSILYQKIINSGDKTFIKTVPVKNNMKLPRDFYQLANIYTKYNKTPITKATPYDGYDIINGRITLSPSYNGVEVVMEYYPAPKTLHLRKKTMDSPYDSPVSVNRTLYVGEEGSIHDINDDSVSLPVTSLNNSTICMFDNALYGRYQEDSDFDYGVLNYNQNDVSGFNYSDCIPLAIDNKLYFYTVADKKIVDINNNYYVDIDLDDYIQDVKVIYCNRGLDTIYFLTDSMVKYVNRMELVSEVHCDILGKCVLNGKNLYGVTKANKLVMVNSTVTIIDTENIPVCMVNDESVLTYRPISRRYFIEGCVESTVMDFSNNIYYIMISYLLAMAFKAKQNADTTALAAQYQLAEAQFFDSLQKDINTQYIIKDEYSVRGFGIWK